MKKYTLRSLLSFFFFALLSISTQSQVNLSRKASMHLFDARQTSDGGYIAFGQSNSADLGLIKLNSSGDSVWTRIYSESTNIFSKSVYECNDGGYILAGGGINSASDYIIILIRTDVNGDTLWTKSYGSAFSFTIRDIKQTFDHGFILAIDFSYSTNGDLSVMKTDSIGSIQWFKVFESPAHDLANSVIQLNDSGYLLNGSIGQNCLWNIALIRLNQFGDTLWTRCYHDPTGIHSELAEAVIASHNRGFAIVGMMGYSTGPTDNDYFLVLVNGQGNLRWSKLYGSVYDDRCFDIVQNASGEFVLVGITQRYGSPADGYLVNTDSTGNEQWSNAYHMPGGFGYPYKIHSTPDGGYVFPSFNGYIIKTNSSGGSCLDSSVVTSTTNSHTIEFNMPFQISTPAVSLIPGNITLYEGIAITDQCQNVLSVNQTSGLNPLLVYPNPARGTMKITLPEYRGHAQFEIYNSSGMKVRSQKRDGNETEIILENMAPGFYCVNMSFENHRYTRKIVFE